jgi:hypothetical protein
VCIGAAPRTASAQQMNFSYYNDQWTSSDGETLYTVSQGSDNSTGCTHYNYGAVASINGPSGYYQQSFSGLYASFDVPFAEGTYSVQNDFTVDCSCFGSSLGAGSDNFSMFAVFTTSFYQGCSQLSPGRCVCAATNCIPPSTSSCGMGGTWFYGPGGCTNYMAVRWIKITYLPIKPINCLWGLGNTTSGAGVCD